MRLAAHHARERVERRLGGDVGGEARRRWSHADRGHVTTCPPPCSRMCGSRARISRTGAEVVELDRALVVVEAVEGLAHRAADRAAGVVDQHVDARRGRSSTVSTQLLDRVEVGQVAWVRRARCRRRPRSRPAARRASPWCVRRGSRCRRRPRSSGATPRPMPDEAPVTITTLPRASDAPSRDLDVEIELQLPVVPQLVGVVLDLRAARCRCPGARCVSRVVEARAVEAHNRAPSQRNAERIG